MHTRTRVCIYEHSKKEYLLLVHKKRWLKHGEPAGFRAQAQLVMEAVAAFNENNVQREAAGLGPLVEKVGHFVSFLTPF